MKAAAALAVVLLGFAACASDDQDVASTTYAEHQVRPQRDLPDEVSDIRIDDGELEVVDLADFRALHQPGHTGLSIPPACGALTPSAAARFAEENLGCGTCYAILCDGDLYAHMCTHQCDGTIEPDHDDTVPITMK